MPKSEYRQRKRKASTNALREIRSEQKRTTLIVPVAPMCRLTNEISRQFTPNLRFKAAAHRALHVATETFMIDLFQKANRAAIHDNRETVQVKDIQLAVELSK